MAHPDPPCSTALAHMRRTIFCLAVQDCSPAAHDWKRFQFYFRIGEPSQLKKISKQNQCFSPFLERGGVGAVVKMPH
jgi:hypothetical protein